MPRKKRLANYSFGFGIKSGADSNQLKVPNLVYAKNIKFTKSDSISADPPFFIETTLREDIIHMQRYDDEILALTYDKIFAYRNKELSQVGSYLNGTTEEIFGYYGEESVFEPNVFLEGKTILHTCFRTRNNIFYKRIDLNSKNTSLDTTRVLSVDNPSARSPRTFLFGGFTFVSYILGNNIILHPIAGLTDDITIPTGLDDPTHYSFSVGTNSTEFRAWNGSSESVFSFEFGTALEDPVVTENAATPSYVKNLDASSDGFHNMSFWTDVTLAGKNYKIYFNTIGYFLIDEDENLVGKFFSDRSPNINVPNVQFPGEPVVVSDEEVLIPFLVSDLENPPTYGFSCLRIRINKETFLGSFSRNFLEFFMGGMIVKYFDGSVFVEQGFSEKPTINARSNITTLASEDVNSLYMEGESEVNYNVNLSPEDFSERGLRIPLGIADSGYVIRDIDIDKRFNKLEIDISRNVGNISLSDLSALRLNNTALPLLSTGTRISYGAGTVEGAVPGRSGVPGRDGTFDIIGGVVPAQGPARLADALGNSLSADPVNEMTTNNGASGSGNLVTGNAFRISNGAFFPNLPSIDYVSYRNRNSGIPYDLGVTQVVSNSSGALTTLNFRKSFHVESSAFENRNFYLFMSDSLSNLRQGINTAVYNLRNRIVSSFTRGSYRIEAEYEDLDRTTRRRGDITRRRIEFDDEAGRVLENVNTVRITTFSVEFEEDDENDENGGLFFTILVKDSNPHIRDFVREQFGVTSVPTTSGQIVDDRRNTRIRDGIFVNNQSFDPYYRNRGRGWSLRYDVGEREWSILFSDNGGSGDDGELIRWGGSFEPNYFSRGSRRYDIDLRLRDGTSLMVNENYSIGSGQTITPERRFNSYNPSNSSYKALGNSFSTSAGTPDVAPVDLVPSRLESDVTLTEGLVLKGFNYVNGRRVITLEGSGLSASSFQRLIVRSIEGDIVEEYAIADATFNMVNSTTATYSFAESRDMFARNTTLGFNFILATGTSPSSFSSSVTGGVLKLTYVSSANDVLLYGSIRSLSTLLGINVPATWDAENLMVSFSHEETSYEITRVSVNTTEMRISFNTNLDNDENIEGLRVNVVVGDSSTRYDYESKERNVLTLHPAEPIDTVIPGFTDLEDQDYTLTVIRPVDETQQVLEDKTYGYFATFSWVDQKGLVHQSELSNISTVINQGDIGEDAVSPTLIEIPYMNLTDKSNTRISLYRTIESGSTYRKVADLENLKDGESISYSDGVKDEDLKEPYLYSIQAIKFQARGGNIVHTFNNRIYVAGQDQFANNIIVSDQQTISSNALNFDKTYNDSVNLFFDNEVVGISSLDNSLIIFTNGETYSYTPGNPPSEILSLKNISLESQRSLVQIKDGIIFKSDQGFYFLGRGYEAQFLGIDVFDINSKRVIDTKVNEFSHEVTFIFDDYTSIRYNFFYKQWSETSGAVKTLFYDDAGTLKVLDLANRVFASDPNKNGIVESVIETGFFDLVNNIQGYSRVDECFLLGDFGQYEDITVYVAYDWNENYESTHRFPGTHFSQFGQPMNANNRYGAGSIGERQISFDIMNPKNSSIKLRIVIRSNRAILSNIAFKVMASNELTKIGGGI